MKRICLMRILQHKVCCKVSHQNRITSLNCLSALHSTLHVCKTSNAASLVRKWSCVRTEHPLLTLSFSKNQWIYSPKESKQERLCPFEKKSCKFLESRDCQPHLQAPAPARKSFSLWAFLCFEYFIMGTCRGLTPAGN